VRQFDQTITRLVIELDSPHHLDNESYRRDRRKDMLLQKNGYFVVRFLVEDVGKRFDDVLDNVLRALAHRDKTAFGQKER
jgi:very-short-patch-repair endonuclease